MQHLVNKRYCRAINRIRLLPRGPCLWGELLILAWLRHRFPTECYRAHISYLEKHNGANVHD